jgi:epoxyqueuosine reductase
MNAHQLKTFIKTEALRLGFSKVGISRPSVFPRRDIEGFENYLEQGFHGTMEWLKSTAEKRFKPETLFPAVKSIVSVAIGYYGGGSYPFRHELGRISRYAWGPDYHYVLKDRLNRLLSLLREKMPSLEGRCFVDSAPVLEKALAAGCGIGWRGKHSLILSETLGSWMFLGELFLNVSLEPDAPVSNRCGSCTRCIDACPTGALSREHPFLLDSRKCIAYMTVEFPGDFSPERSEHLRLAGYTWGCDICQEACPWNRPDIPISNAFIPQTGTYNIHLDDVTAMSNKKYKKHFQNTSLHTVKKDLFLRNVMVHKK